jgi:hypothetical protein
MKKDVVPVHIRGLLPANSGCALFVGNDEKVFVIQVEHNMGAIIGMALRGTHHERPAYPRPDRPASSPASASRWSASSSPS